ncbi:nucleotide cyclase [Chytridium lagenaria]|nr:nucleotide cyclase [Chytridium lagenaria]
MSTKGDEGQQRSYSLSLHVALAEGHGSHIIIGNPSERLDYLVYSDRLRDIGKMLDGTKSGELGIPLDLALSLQLEGFASRTDTGFFVFKGEPLKLALDVVRNSCAASKPLLRRTEIFRSDVNDTKLSMRSHEDDSKLLKNFVNKSILWRLEEQVEPAQDVSDSSSLSRKISLRLRAPEKALYGGVIRTEYRTISILFIKINNTFDSMIAQKLFTLLLDKLKTFDGVFQQYSVDDKGQSMLACFGLPPFIHEKCALFAVKAGASFMSDLGQKQLMNITVGITTGDILFGTVGTENRRDTALLGDMINVAARLLSLHKNGMIVMDDYTKSLVESAFPVDDMGSVNYECGAYPPSHPSFVEKLYIVTL